MPQFVGMDEVDIRDTLGVVRGWIDKERTEGVQEVLGLVTVEILYNISMQLTRIAHAVEGEHTHG